MMEAYDREPSFIASDPPDHDRARRQCMRFFGPPHSPDVIPSQEPLCKQIVNELLDKASEKAIGKTRIDVVDEFAYPLPVNLICRIMGVPIEDEPQFHAWIADAMAGIFDVGPEIATEEGRARRAKGEASQHRASRSTLSVWSRKPRTPLARG